MDEMSLKAGDLIMLKSRIGSDWLRGRTINGKEGIFPKSFVEVVVSTCKLLNVVVYTHTIHTKCTIPFSALAHILCWYPHCYRT